MVGSRNNPLYGEKWRSLRGHRDVHDVEAKWRGRRGHVHTSHPQLTFRIKHQKQVFRRKTRAMVFVGGVDKSTGRDSLHVHFERLYPGQGHPLGQSRRVAMDCKTQELFTCGMTICRMTLPGLEQGAEQPSGSAHEWPTTVTGRTSFIALAVVHHRDQRGSWWQSEHVG